MQKLRVCAASAILVLAFLSGCAHQPTVPPVDPPRLPVLPPELAKPPPPPGWFLDQCLKVLTSGQCSGT